MTRDEALSAIRLLHAYARGTLTPGQPGQPSIEERAWAQALELDAIGATLADATVGVRRAATERHRPTLHDVVRCTLAARDERRRDETTAVPPERTLPATTGDGPGYDPARWAAAVAELLEMPAGRLVALRADEAELGQRLKAQAEHIEPDPKALTRILASARPPRMRYREPGGGAGGGG